MLNSTIAPPIIDPVAFDIKLPAYKKYTLANGVEIFAVDMGTEDTLMVNWVFYAGNWFEKKKAIAAATNFLLKNGTSKRNAFEINEHFLIYSMPPWVIGDKLNHQPSSTPKAPGSTPVTYPQV